MSNAPELSGQFVRDQIVATAQALGFHRVGIIPIEAPARFAAYQDWLAKAYHGSMGYMAASEHISGRRDLRKLCADARTLVVVALAYDATRPKQPSGGRPYGLIARYAQGADYHHVLKRKLQDLANTLSSALSRPIAARPCVDSAPVLERDFAERAGIGFVAKNTMVIAPGLGSYFVLGELLLDVDAMPTSPERSSPRCGSCRSCLDACPTGAFADPYILDARLCISYLTIEHKGPIPLNLRKPIDNMIFGCDICQEVCPYNQRAPARIPPAPELRRSDPNHSIVDLIELLQKGANQRRRYVDGTTLRRVNREQLLRNVCIALGNAGDPQAIGPLTTKLSDRSALVRGHAAWALGQLGMAEACVAALANETDPWVREELSDAIRQAASRECKR